MYVNEKPERVRNQIKVTQLGIQTQLCLVPESRLYEDHPEDEMDTRHAETLLRQRQNSIQM